MMRIAGTNIPKEKKIRISLRYIFGVGPTLAEKILKQAKVDGELRTKDLTPEQEDKIRALVEKEHVTEGDLRREIGANIKRLKDIKCYRGVRHMRHLPVRGQRTKTNSRTVRGNTRKTMGSGRAKSGIKT
ncbi:MAG TPA: 30S ribosomal protein S13 [Candidatus Magasanikbacteria bacterium]|nr:30S ribosomal protein S13 [Candidatus Magasanikbacteria bacterium]